MDPPRHAFSIHPRLKTGHNDTCGVVPEHALGGYQPGSEFIVVCSVVRSSWTLLQTVQGGEGDGRIIGGHTNPSCMA